MMKRRLVLTNEAARHPLRQRLPKLPVQPIASAPDDGEELKLFALSFTAFFIAIYGVFG